MSDRNWLPDLGEALFKVAIGDYAGAYNGLQNADKPRGPEAPKDVEAEVSTPAREPAPIAVVEMKEQPDGTFAPATGEDDDGCGKTFTVAGKKYICASHEGGECNLRRLA